jgi:hypothetical protein
MRKYLASGAVMDIEKNETGGFDVNIVSAPKTFDNTEAYLKNLYDTVYGALTDLKNEGILAGGKSILKNPFANTGDMFKRQKQIVFRTGNEQHNKKSSKKTTTKKPAVGKTDITVPLPPANYTSQYTWSNDNGNMQISKTIQDAYAKANGTYKGDNISPPDGDEKTVAQKILETNNVTFDTIHSSPPKKDERKDGATAYDNIHDAAAGKLMKTSEYGDAKGQQVALNPAAAQAFLTLAIRHQLEVSEISGGKHTGPDAAHPTRMSAHYSGRAFDIVKIDGVPVTKKSGNYKAFEEEARGLGFYVLGPGDPDHDTHIHLQWNVRSPSH